MSTSVLQLSVLLMKLMMSSSSQSQSMRSYMPWYACVYCDYHLCNRVFVIPNSKHPSFVNGLASAFFVHNHTLLVFTNAYRDSHHLCIHFGEMQMETPGHQGAKMACQIRTGWVLYWISNDLSFFLATF